MELPAAREPALALDAITCTFAARGDHARRGHYTAVRDTSIAVAPGEFVSVVGPTGCGKSTLLNVAAGLLAPSAGRVNVFGKRLAGINAHAGYMFQADALMPWRSALANVTAGLEFRGVPKAEANARGHEWLRRVGLAGFPDRYPHQLSGGMRKRVALAQMLILDPEILLMDEPFSALDVQTRQLMENELLDLWSRDDAGEGPPRAGGVRSGVEQDAGEGPPRAGGVSSGVDHRRKSVLFITHDLEEAISLSDRVIVLSAGPGTSPIGEFTIDLPRPRDVAEIRLTPRFVELHQAIWATMKEEVLKGYVQSQR